jgi:hypothetical protein
MIAIRGVLTRINCQVNPSRWQLDRHIRIENCNNIGREGEIWHEEKKANLLSGPSRSLNVLLKTRIGFATDQGLQEYSDTGLGG